MTRHRFKEIIAYKGGFHYGSLGLSEPGEYMAGDTANVFFTAPGRWQPFIGSPLMFQVGADFFGLGNRASAATSKGSIVSFIGGSVVYVGAGEEVRL